LIIRRVKRLTPRELKQRLPVIKVWAATAPFPAHVTRRQVWAVMEEVHAGSLEFARELNRDPKTIRRMIARHLPADGLVGIEETELKLVREGMHLAHCPPREWLSRYGSKGMLTGRDVPLEQPFELPLK
jgi:hypothetical protein